jgi:Flavodoxin
MNSEESEMDLVNILICTAVGIILLIVVAGIAAGVLFCGDIMSYMATGSTTLSPSGTSAGKALVVYNPGITGEARSAAEKIAGDFQAKGYTVTLAGIKSSAAADTSGYDVIVAGGPMYFGRVSNSVDAYLNGLKPGKDTEVGVFATTGSGEFHNEDIASLGKQVAATAGISTLNKTAVTKTLRNGDAINADCLDFVSAVA